MIDPLEFVITRKRKKYKFAKFANSPLCFEYADWQMGRVDVLEVGAGNGLFSVELATRHPERNYAAFDIKGDRLQKGALEAESRGLTNIQFVRGRADQLLEVFSPGSLGAIWLTFPDPFPRTRSSGRRLTHPTFLSLYRQLLAKDGGLYLKHDDCSFFHWSLEQLVATGWNLSELSFNLHESELNNDYKVMTSYEIRWISEGFTTNFTKAMK